MAEYMEAQEALMEACAVFQGISGDYQWINPPLEMHQKMVTRLQGWVVPYLEGCLENGVENATNVQILLSVLVEISTISVRSEYATFKELNKLFQLSTRLVQLADHLQLLQGTKLEDVLAEDHESMAEDGNLVAIIMFNQLISNAAPDVFAEIVTALVEQLPADCDLATKLQSIKEKVEERKRVSMEDIGHLALSFHQYIVDLIHRTVEEEKRTIFDDAFYAEWRSKTDSSS